MQVLPERDTEDCCFGGSAGGYREVAVGLSLQGKADPGWVRPWTEFLASARPVVTAIASDHRAARERVPGQRAVGLRLRKDGPAVVRAVAGLAGRLITIRHVLVGTDPGGADRVQSVRPTGYGVGDRSVARCALDEHSHMPLQGGALDVVVDNRSGEFGVRRAVAGFALQAAVAAGESVHRKSCRRRVCIGGEGLIGSDAHRRAAGEYGGIDDLPAVGGRGPRVALLAGGFIEPSLPRG